MVEILLIIIAVILALIAGFLIPTLLELRNSSREMHEFMARVESELKPVIDEFTEVLKNVKGITSGVNSITDDVKKFSSAVGDAGDKIRKITAFAEGLPFKAAGVRAGVGAAIGFIVAQMFKKKGPSEEEEHGEED